jgi:hypothetical protein
MSFEEAFVVEHSVFPESSNLPFIHACCVCVYVCVCVCTSVLCACIIVTIGIWGVCWVKEATDHTLNVQIVTYPVFKPLPLKFEVT